MSLINVCIIQLAALVTATLCVLTDIAADSWDPGKRTETSICLFVSVFFLNSSEILGIPNKSLPITV